MEQPEKMAGNSLRHFLVGGSLNGGTFGITISTKRQVSAKEVLAYLLEHEAVKPTDMVDMKITSIYEFKDEADYLDFKKDEAWARQLNMAAHY